MKVALIIIASLFCLVSHAAPDPAKKYSRFHQPIPFKTEDWQAYAAAEKVVIEDFTVENLPLRKLCNQLDRTFDKSRDEGPPIAQVFALSTNVKEEPTFTISLQNMNGLEMINAICESTDNCTWAITQGCIIIKVWNKKRF